MISQSNFQVDRPVSMRRDVIQTRFRKKTLLATPHHQSPHNSHSISISSIETTSSLSLGGAAVASPCSILLTNGNGSNGVVQQPTGVPAILNAAHLFATSPGFFLSAFDANNGGGGSPGAKSDLTTTTSSSSPVVETEVPKHWCCFLKLNNIISFSVIIFCLTAFFNVENGSTALFLNRLIWFSTVYTLKIRSHRFLWKIVQQCWRRRSKSSGTFFVFFVVEHVVHNNFPSPSFFASFNRRRSCLWVFRFALEIFPIFRLWICPESCKFPCLKKILVNIKRWNDVINIYFFKTIFLSIFLNPDKPANQHITDTCSYRSCLIFIFKLVPWFVFSLTEIWCNL